MLRFFLSCPFAPLAATVSLLTLTTLPSYSLEPATTTAPNTVPSSRLPGQLAQAAFDPIDSNPTATIGGGVRFKQPADQPSMAPSAPTRSRGNCSRDPQNSSPKLTDQLKPLLPPGVALTVAARPTVLVYVPVTCAEKMTFLLQDAKGQFVYEMSVVPTQTPRIVNFTLPEIAPELKVGEDYRWFVSLDCGVAEPSGNPLTAGIIRRVPAETIASSNALTPISLTGVKAYAEAGIWYDAVSDLATLRRAAPTDRDLLVAWTELLRSVGLEQYATVPVQGQAMVRQSQPPQL